MKNFICGIMISAALLALTYAGLHYPDEIQTSFEDSVLPYLKANWLWLSLVGYLPMGVLVVKLSALIEKLADGKPPCYTVGGIIAVIFLWPIVAFAGCVFGVVVLLIITLTPSCRGLTNFLVNWVNS